MQCTQTWPRLIPGSPPSHPCHLMTSSSSDSRNSLNQVALPIRANLPVLSTPDNSWNAGNAFAFSGPNAVHNGLICWTPEIIEIEVFFGNKSQLAMIKTRTLVPGENNVISASLEIRSVADTPKHIIKVSASSWAHILVAPGMAHSCGDDQIGWIFVVVQSFLSQIFCQNSLCLFMWQKSLIVMCQMLVSSRTRYWTWSFHFRLFCLVVLFRESALYVLKTTMTSPKLFVRFISLSLKHTLRTFTVTSVAGFVVIFWTIFHRWSASAILLKHHVQAEGWTQDHLDASSFETLAYDRLNSHEVSG